MATTSQSSASPQTPATKEEAAQAQPEPTTTTLPRTPFEHTVQGRLDTIDQRLTRLEDQRERILEFSFQSILVVLTILGLAVGIPFALLYGTRISSGDISYAIASLLAGLVVLMIIWLRLWWTVNVNRKRISSPAGLK
jgi:uncharacterized membrane protein